MSNIPVTPAPFKSSLKSKMEHQRETDHKVRFSIHDSAWWCVDCDWMEFAGITEEEIDKLVEAEYHCENSKLNDLEKLI